MENIENLLKFIVADYAKWTLKADGTRPSYSQGRLEKMESGEFLSYTVGKKYIKIVQENSVWGFVVNTHDDPKFKYGDILKAAGWAAPAKNFARGNVLTGEYGNSQWTGAM